MGAPKGNKYALGNKGGRPPLYTNPIELQNYIDAYFESGGEERQFIIGSGKDKQLVKIQIFTITGLCYFCGFDSRQSFYDYEQKKEFAYTIKRARLRIEKMYEENLQYGNTTGSIFALKNMDWDDKQTYDHNLNGNLNVTPLEFFKTNKNK